MHIRGDCKMIFTTRDLYVPLVYRLFSGQFLVQTSKKGPCNCGSMDPVIVGQWDAYVH